jgi:hypothetical protein
LASPFATANLRSEKSIHLVRQEIAARKVLPWRETYLWVRKIIAATGPIPDGFEEK